MQSVDSPAVDTRQTVSRERRWVPIAGAAAAVMLLVGVPFFVSHRAAPPSALTASGPSREQARAAQAEAEAHPQDPVLQLGHGRIRLERNEPDLAISSLSLAARSPQTALAAAVSLEQCGRQFNRYEAVLPGLQSAVAAAPGSSRTWEALIRALDAMGRREPAQAALDEALRRFPGSTRLEFVKAELLQARGETLASVRLYEETLKRDPDPQAQLAVALLLARMDAPQRAKTAFRKALDLSSTSVIAYLGLAKANMELGLLTEAEQATYAALQVAPEDPEALLMLARVLMERGTDGMRTSRELLERVLVQRPGHLEARYHLGVLLLRTNDPKAAARHFEAVLEQQPYRLDARQNYAKALKQAGNDKESARQQQLANGMAQLEQTRSSLMNRISLSPTSVDLRCELAEFYLEHDAAPLAEREFQRVLQMDPKNTRAAAGLARARKPTP